jgi:hypothetical protein
VAHTGWHWMLERWERLRQFPFPRPEITVVWLVSAMHWLMAALILAGLVWLVSGLLRRRATA